MMEALEGIAENQERAIGEAITARSIAIDYYQVTLQPSFYTHTHTHYTRLHVPMSCTNFTHVTSTHTACMCVEHCLHVC